MAKAATPFDNVVRSALVAAVDDPITICKIAAVRSLDAEAKVNPEVQDALIKALQRAQDSDVSDHILRSLGPDRLLKMLEDEDRAMRKTAARALSTTFPGLSPADRISRGLVPLLAESETEIRQLAIQAISHIASRPVTYSEVESVSVPTQADRDWVVSEIVPALEKCLHDPNASVRSESARALGCLGSEARSVTPSLVSLLADQDSRVRQNAAGVLGLIGPAAQDSIKPLVRALRDSQPEVRAAATRSLERVGAKGGEVEAGLTAVLADADADARAAAASALAVAGSATDVAPLLIKAMGDADDKVRRSVLAALGGLDATAAPQTVPALVEALRQDIDADLCAALVRVGKGSPLVESHLIDLLDTNDADLQSKAIWMLSKVGTNAATAALIHVIGNSDQSGLYDNGQQAAQTLAMIGPNPTEAVELILDLNLDQAEWDLVENELSQILRDIGPAAMSELIKGLEDSNSRRRLMSAWATGGYGAGGKSAVDALAKLTRDRDKKCRRAAIEALGQTGATCQDAITVLIGALPTAKGEYEGEYEFAENAGCDPFVERYWRNGCAISCRGPA